MALPWMESLTVWGDTPPAGVKPASEAPVRLAVLFSGNGFHSKEWWAKGEGRQMELGKDLTGADVGKALLARTQLFRQVQGWFDHFDVILTPTLARTAIPIEERLFEPVEIEGRKTDTVRKAWYPYTHPFNLTGHPAVSLPCGLHSDGLPVAIQLVGRRGEDARLFKVAALYEQARPWAHLRPKIEGL